ncbi:hypothetical protein MCAP1_003387 [Malassezia caprae]|uniref:Uncharacterized protein n=1 Tax=Malassezia caprae TaxID=1381934 RepID=A0AAF0J1K8_9BASI|nr:hypothetical protein MCAP1_003387 [Malassezia caprae]
MKFLALATLAIAPAVFAASTPFHCKTLAKSAYLTADGPAETIEFFNISKVSAGENAHYLQNDGHPYNGDDIDSDFSKKHERFDLARCQMRNSNSSLPQTFLRVHLSKDTNQCLTIGGAGASSKENKDVSEAFTHVNTLFMKPCEGPSGSAFVQQVFKDNGDEATYPYYIETIESDSEQTRNFVGFKDDKVFLLAQEPKSHSSPPGNFKLYVDKFD